MSFNPRAVIAETDCEGDTPQKWPGSLHLFENPEDDSPWYAGIDAANPTPFAEPFWDDYS